MLQALKIQDENEDTYPIGKGLPTLFKIETEDGCFAIYEVCKSGGLKVSKGYDGPFTNCILRGWDVLPEGCQHLPTYEEYRRKPLLAVVA